MTITPTINTAAAIATTQVTKSWGQHQVFSNLTASVPKGITGLLGSNGSGKTTLLGMLLGLHQPDSGQLSVLGRDPTTDGAGLRERIGYSPEHQNLPGDVAAQDLVRHIAQVHGLPKREATTRSSDALWLVGLGEERARPVGTMSTGQKQRVKLAQALAHGPSLVLLDEPTDGLDPVQRDGMLELIRRVGTEFGIDIVLSSHLLEEVERVADNVMIISDGVAVASGPINELQTGGSGVTVVVSERAEELAQALRSSGLEVGPGSGRGLTVSSPDGSREAQLTEIVRDALVEVGAPLRLLQGKRRSLEDVFLTEVHGQ